MKKEEFILMRNNSGVLCRRYFKRVKQADGKIVRKYYKLEKANLPERAKFRVNEILHPATDKLREKYKKRTIKLLAGTAALFVVANLGLGALLVKESNEKDVPARSSSTYSTRADKDEVKVEKREEEEKPKVPEIVTYTKYGDEYIDYDSALAVAKYNYESVVKELEENNKTASEKNKLKFDANKFDPAIFVGAQYRESSLKTFDSDSSSNKGPFQIGVGALEDANKIAEKLYGAPVANSTNELINPIVGSRACMYYYIYMYENLATQFKGKNIEVTQAMVIDSYFHGVGTIGSAVINGEYLPRAYARRIQAYGDAYGEYYDLLYNKGLLNKDHSKEKKELENKILEIEKKNFSINQEELQN